MQSLAPEPAARGAIDHTRHGLYENAWVSMALHRCYRKDRGRSDEEVQPRHVLIFPVSGVNVVHVADRCYVVDPSQVTLLNEGEVYVVSHPEGSGETTLHVAVENGALLELLARRHPDLPVSADRSFALAQVPRSPRVHVELACLLATSAALAAREHVEEAALALIDGVVDELTRSRGLPTPASSASDRELARDAATRVAARYAEPLTLTGLAEELGVSKFRLARAFKRATGDTIWQRVQQLRVRRAVVELAAGAEDLTELGLALGFSSHSHFSRTFHRVFGATPSAVRSRLRC